MADGMGEQPLAFGRLLSALDFYLNPGYEIAIMGEPSAEDTRALLAEVRRRFCRTAWSPRRRPAARQRSGARCSRPPARTVARATAYVCRNYACNLPVTGVQQLAEQLDGG